MESSSGLSAMPTSGDELNHSLFNPANTTSESEAALSQSFGNVLHFDDQFTEANSNELDHIILPDLDDAHIASKIQEFSPTSPARDIFDVPANEKRAVNTKESINTSVNSPTPPSNATGVSSTSESAGESPPAIMYYKSWTRDAAGYRFSGKNFRNRQVVEATAADWYRLLPQNSLKRKRMFNDHSDDAYVSSTTAPTGTRRSERRSMVAATASRQVESDTESDESDSEYEAPQRSGRQVKRSHKSASLPTKPVAKATSPLVSASPKATPVIKQTTPKVTGARTKVSIASPPPSKRSTRNSRTSSTPAIPAAKRGTRNSRASSPPANPPKTRKTAPKETILTWSYEMRYVLDRLYEHTTTTTGEKRDIFNHVFKSELTLLGLYKKIDSEKMRKQYGSKTRDDRPIPDQWIQIIADEQVDAANDAAGIMGGADRLLRDTIKDKIAAAALHLNITL
ncbi:uncharacterized protein RCC_09922 [Ramularia collo-cygni]|uniref:Uncharacterized protein n=1 Tax=Ramularia collo-cygni TaxID=112498 RepID=A0A2D3VEG3_9PEZI|nr:uncharacterized protein RCC_09922 [Ramularia collo-cygni]CZT24205.1 uncharacterized protein RCC_09922 [Ramularia collo-cygni]